MGRWLRTLTEVAHEAPHIKQESPMSPVFTPQSPLQVSLTPIKPMLAPSRQHPLHVMARLQAPHNADASRAPLSIALVIDRSGSMSGDRLEAARACVRSFVRGMNDEDEIALIAYDQRVHVVLPLMVVADARHVLTRVLSTLCPGGRTDLHAGWVQGARVLAPRTNHARICRVILLSDGQANHGKIGVDDVCVDVKSWAERGVSTSTVGIGLDFNEELMTAMAMAGGGHAMYGDHADQLAEPFESEIALLSQLAWRDVRLTLGSASSSWRAMNDYVALDELTWRLPDIANGSEAWMCFEIPTQSAIRAQRRSRSHSALHITVEARNAVGELHRFKCSLPTLPEVSDEVWSATDADERTAGRLIELLAADIQRQIRRSVRRSLWDEAESLMRHLEELARDNPWVRQVLDQLRQLLDQRDQAALSKELHFSAMRMSQRLADVDETTYDGAYSESRKVAYLRKKTLQGRRTF